MPLLWAEGENARGTDGSDMTRASETAGRCARGGMVAAAIIGCATVVVACGASSGPTATTNPAGYASELGFSKCMRAHGLRDFPDPTAAGRVVFPSALDQRSPAFRSAEAACAKGQSPPGGSAAQIPESQKLELVAAARCMRKHGVPHYPDPTFRGGFVDLGGGPGAGVNHSSPAFRDAARICHLPVPR